MRIVSNTGPLIGLAKIDCLSILKQIASEVCIPPINFKGQAKFYQYDLLFDYKKMEKKSDWSRNKSNASRIISNGFTCQVKFFLRYI